MTLSVKFEITTNCLFMRALVCLVDFSGVLESVIKPITSVSPFGKVSKPGISMTTFACLGKACDVVKLTYNRVVVWT